MDKIHTIIDDMISSDDPGIIRLGERLSSELDRVHEEINKEKSAHVTLKAKYDELRNECREIEAENRVYRRRIIKLEREMFGQSSEKAKRNKKKDNEEDPDNKPLGDDADQPAVAIVSRDKVKPKSKPRGMQGRGKKNFPKDLEREYVDMPPETTKCPCGCGEEGYIVGVDEIERIAFQRAKVWVKVECYAKRKCSNCQTFWQSKVPPQMFKGNYTSNEFLAGIITNKYADFLPLYRQAEILKRSGVNIHRSSLTRWSNQALLEALKPIWELMSEEIKRSSNLQMDETTAPTQAPGTGKVKNAYALALLRDQRRCMGNEPPCVVFQYAPSRAGLHIEEMLHGFDGALQVDGYAGYNRLQKETREGGAPIALAYCWAHVRRKFNDLKNSDKSKPAQYVIDEIQKLYAIEADLKGKTALIRRQVRQQESAQIVKSLREFLIAQSQIGLAKDGLGEAINYTLKLWDGLTVFLNDGRVEIDNNNVENVIRKWVMCRKNCLFAGSELGGEAWAIAASIIGTCALLGINCHDYIRWVFDQIASKLPRAEYWKLLPWEYEKAIR